MNMNDDQYKDFLNALAAKYLRPSKLTLADAERLRSNLERLKWISKLKQLAQEDEDRPELVERLRSELLQSPLSSVADAMDKIGLLEALDEGKAEIFWNLRPEVIPAEDLQLLREAGFTNPEAEITLLVRYARTHLSDQGRDSTTPSEIVFRAKDELQKAAGQLTAPETPRKKRKLFNGIGKILGGAVAGAGNVLIACGTILAPNPATIYTALGSGAIAVAGIGQGIGDLRGE